MFSKKYAWALAIGFIFVSIEQVEASCGLGWIKQKVSSFNRSKITGPKISVSSPAATSSVSEPKYVGVDSM